MKKTLIIILAILLLGGGIFAYMLYNQSTASSIIGSWKNDSLGINFIYTFYSDGTGSYDMGGTVKEFTYKIEGDKLSVLYTGDTEPFVNEFEIDGDTLNVIDSNGDDTLYKRYASKQNTKKEETKKEETTTKEETKKEETTTKEETKKEETKKEETTTTTTSSGLKGNKEEAERQIKLAMQNLLKDTYGNKVFDARIYVEKIYTAEEEQKIDALRDKKLGDNEVAFKVKYEIKPASGVDPEIFTAASGRYDKEKGWVVDKYNSGILRPTGNDDPKYKITNFGTGW